MFLDIYTKSFIRAHFFIGEIFPILPGVNLCCVLNSGIAFGLLSNIICVYQKIYIALIILVIIMVVFFLYGSNCFCKTYSFSYSMMIGGALGNLYDRILYGAVIDFIDIYVANWHWPAFNIADVTIFFGFFLLIKEHFFNFYNI
ncbi:signal peptidase II [Candidatus Blochmannia ocreatus]|uniref:Lipoprotein signal peptidase n=2 Tax=Candidatus Blochmannia ocreatus (nom. nud.) TaxID=251538 RepID=A0ABY4ST97_9ENTR|nr:signal peptidase II [Candidatus Blochmannia ocreatus]